MGAIASPGQEGEAALLRRENAGLRDALAQTQNLLAIAPAFIGFLSLEGVILDLNDLALRIIEARKDDVVGRRFWEAPWWAPVPESAARVRGAVEQCAAGRTASLDLEYWSSSDGAGSRRWVALALTPLHGAGGAVSVLAATGIDITDRRHSEEALRRNQRQLDAILEHLPAAVYLKDLEGRYLLANRRARELKGDNILGRTDREIFPPAVAEAIAGHDRTVLTTRESFESDEEIPTAAGPTTQLSIKFPIPGEDGAPTGLGGISTDITERKWQEKIAEAERRALEQTAQGAPIDAVLAGLVQAVEGLGVGMVASIDVHGGNGRTSASSPGPGLRPCWSRTIVNARGEPLATFAVGYREPRAPVAAHLRIAGQLERTLSVILERRRFEQERATLVADLGAAKARYQSLFDGTAEAILVIAPDGRYRDANRAASELTGYSQEELRQLRVGDLSHASDQSRERWARLSGEGRWRGEIELRRKDGSVVPVETLIASVALPAGLVYVSTMRNVSERRALDRLRRDFLAVVGHELRNPLNSIMGSAEVMRTSGAYSQRSIDRILRQTRQLERIITDLQETHNIESGHLRLRKRHLNLLPLLRACADEAAAAAGNHAVRLECDEAAITGTWDGDRVCQVLRNLLSNAIKYSPEGSEVVVRVSSTDEVVRVAISDQGPGIAKDMLPRLFERYYRAPQTAEKVPGMGVGLFVCKELIERHGGRLAVESEPGRGSTFSFELPRQGLGAGDLEPA